MKHYKSNTEQKLAIIICSFTSCCILSIFLTVSQASRLCFLPRSWISILSECLSVPVPVLVSLSVSLITDTGAVNFVRATAVIVVDEMFGGNINSLLLKQEYCVQFSYRKTLRIKTYYCCKKFCQSVHKVVLS